MDYSKVFGVFVAAASLTACAGTNADSLATESPKSEMSVDEEETSVDEELEIKGVELDPEICTLEWVSRTGEQVATVGEILSDQSVIQDAYYTERGVGLDDARERNLSAFNFYSIEISISDVLSARKGDDSPELTSGDSLLLASPVPRQLDSITSGSFVVLSDGALNGDDAWTAQAWGSTDSEGLLRFSGMCASELQSEFMQAAEVIGALPDSRFLQELTATAYQDDSVVNEFLEYEAPTTTIDQERAFSAIPAEDRQLLAGEVPQELSSLYSVAAFDLRPDRDFIQPGRLVRIHSDVGQSYLGDSSVAGVTPFLIGTGLPHIISVADESKTPLSWTEIGVIELDSETDAFALLLSNNRVEVEKIAPADFEKLTLGAELQPLIDDLSSRWFRDD